MKKSTFHNNLFSAPKGINIQLFYAVLTKIILEKCLNSWTASEERRYSHLEDYSYKTITGVLIPWFQPISVITGYCFFVQQEDANITFKHA